MKLYSIFQESEVLKLLVHWEIFRAAFFCLFNILRILLSSIGAYESDYI